MVGYDKAGAALFRQILLAFGMYPHPQDAEQDHDGLMQIKPQEGRADAFGRAPADDKRKQNKDENVGKAQPQQIGREEQQDPEGGNAAPQRRPYGASGGKQKIGVIPGSVAQIHERDSFHGKIPARPERADP